MGIFGSGTNDAIVDEVEKATNENNKEENWELIITICDRAGKSADEARSYLRAIIRRLNSQDPHIAIQAITLLDACVKNSGKFFHIEVASREFETEYNKLLSKAHITVTKKLRESLKRWAENEFKQDQQLNLIPSLYTKLKNSGVDFNVCEMPVKKSTPVSKDPNVVESQQEEDEILKAIELSLKETSTSPRKTSLYPSTNVAAASNPTSSTPAKEAKKVRALYDFEAAEDNELTFHSGEIIFVIDDADPNWWKGSNQRGEGLFPSNFVTMDLSIEPDKFLFEKAKKIVQFKENAEAKPTEKEPECLEIDSDKIDRLLNLLHEADPTNPESDTAEMLQLEKEVNLMGPLIDTELEKVDRKHAQLTQLSADLVESLGLYHTLMREPQFTPKLPYNLPQMQHQTLPHTMPQHASGPSLAHLPAAPPNFNGPQGPIMPPPGLERQPFMGHYGTMPMMGPPPGMPPHLAGVMPDDRRMHHYGGQMIPPNFPTGPVMSQSMIHNGVPQPPTQSQHFMPPANAKQ